MPKRTLTAICFGSSRSLPSSVFRLLSSAWIHTSEMLSQNWLSTLSIKIVSLEKKTSKITKIRHHQFIGLYKRLYGQRSRCYYYAAIFTHFTLPSRIQITTVLPRPNSLRRYALGVYCGNPLPYCTQLPQTLHKRMLNEENFIAIVSPLRSICPCTHWNERFFLLFFGAVERFFPYFPSLRATKYFHYMLHEHHITQMVAKWNVTCVYGEHGGARLRRATCAAVRSVI